MKGSNSRAAVVENGNTNNEEEIEWEMRPGGMLVQKRDDDGCDGHDHGADGGGIGGSTIKIKVSHGSTQHDLAVPSQSTFGDLKRVIGQETGVEPKEQRLLFRGKEKEDQECLHLAGVKDNSKMLLMEDSASKERKLEEVTGSSVLSRGGDAVAEVKMEVDKLSEQVSALQAVVYGGTQVDGKDIVYLTEMLMRQLLKLDSIEAEGEGKVQRKMEVHRVQSFVETVDALKARNSNPFSNSSNAVSVTTQWETFESGVGSLNAPPPMPSSTFESGVGSLNAPPPMPSSTKVTQDWEHFD